MNVYTDCLWKYPDVGAVTKIAQVGAKSAHNGFGGQNLISPWGQNFKKKNLKMHYNKKKAASHRLALFEQKNCPT